MEKAAVEQNAKHRKAFTQNLTNRNYLKPKFRAFWHAFRKLSAETERIALGNRVLNNLSVRWRGTSTVLNYKSILLDAKAQSFPNQNFSQR